MSDFRIRHARRSPKPHYPIRDDFSPAELTRRPFRTGASRALAAAVATLTATGVAAGGLSWNALSGQGSRMQLAGDIAMPIGPRIAETIAPCVAEAVVTRLFAEAGISVQGARDDVVGGVRLSGFDARRSVGFAILDRGDFSSERAWAQWLERVLGPDSHLPSDPRDMLENWDAPLTPAEQAELKRAFLLSGQGPTEMIGEEGEHVMCLDVRDLVVQERWGGYFPDDLVAATERAAALRRLESQVGEFLSYLQSQGI